MLKNCRIQNMFEKKINKNLEVVNMPKIIWEKLVSEIGGKETNSKIWRSKVPGGWLVRIHSVKEEVGENEHFISWAYAGLTFIPDSDHTWDGNSLP